MSRKWVLNDESFTVNEIWDRSDRSAYCKQCKWTSPMRSIAYRVDDYFPHRCPKCGTVTNRKGEK